MQRSRLAFYDHMHTYNILFALQISTTLLSAATNHHRVLAFLNPESPTTILIISHTFCSIFATIVLSLHLTIPLAAQQNKKAPGR